VNPHVVARLRAFVAPLPAVVLLALLPRPVARAAEDASGAPSVAPAERALLPHILTLRAPGARSIRLARSDAVIGSSADDVLLAAASCASEPLGHRCNAQTFASELGRHIAQVGSFWIDRTEVTVREYSRCVAAGRCERPAYAAGGRRFERPFHPVTFVSHEDALSYCHFRGARLPTELEFERAARGARGRVFPWGELYHSRAANHGRFALLPNDDEDGFAELAPVGSFAVGRTPEGVLDLAGNVAEWVADAYRESYDDPPPQNSDARRVVRGGSYATGPSWLRGAARDSAPPGTRRPDLGFRCAQSAGPG